MPPGAARLLPNLLLFFAACATCQASGSARNEYYPITKVCKDYFLRDLYRKIEGAVITSQNERNLDCAITFQTHSILQRFMLRFDSLNLDCNDHLYIYDGANAVGNYKADLTCRNTVESVGSIYTRTNFVTLKYTTDGWGTEINGFRLVITAVKDPKHTCKDFRCNLKEFCINTGLLCDGVNHCADGSDEAPSTLCSNVKAATILGMETAWFAVALVFVVLITLGIVAGGILCFCRQRAATPRHLHNAHNMQGHPPVSFPCFMMRRCARTMRRSLVSRRYCIVPMIMLMSTFSLLHVVLSKSLIYDNLIEEDPTITSSRDFFIGPCLIHTNTSCPDEEITFFLYTRQKGDEAEQILVNDSWSNLDDTNFRKYRPTKIIVHGYNSDMQLDALVDIRNEYMKKGSYNIIAVDWHRLAAGPCYPIAVQNVPHVGNCLAQLVQRLRDQGANNIHVIGFSLGAHVPAYSANALRPYKVSRITGLDPAMPLFVTVSRDHKLDASDARFVDVFHTNAFIQGKIEMSGHVDFYMNGGINQPGCWRTSNPFGCSHHRSAEYFAESINSELGFWGWPCPNFFTYLLGLCPPRFPAILAGEDVHQYNKGFHLVRTNSQSPFAQGLFAVDPRDTNK